MFEHYTERARRVIFFGRFEASQFGSLTIESEHLLLGLIRGDKSLMNRLLRQGFTIESIAKEIENLTPKREKVSTSIDLPLSPECKRILALAEEEVRLLGRVRHIGTEHILLGIVREGKCLAAQILSAHGLRLAAVQDELSQNSPQGSESAPVPQTDDPGSITPEAASSHVDLLTGVFNKRFMDEILGITSHQFDSTGGCGLQERW